MGMVDVSLTEHCRTMKLSYFRALPNGGSGTAINENGEHFPYATKEPSRQTCKIIYSGEFMGNESNWRILQHLFIRRM
jgi:hypothetical protein